MNVRSKVTAVLAVNAFYWIGTLALLAGVLYCSAAVYLSLREPLDPALAALVTGVGLLIVAGLPFAVGAWKSRRRRRQQPDSAELEALLRQLADDDSLQEMLRGRAAGATAAALLAGALLGASPTVRSAASRLLKDLSGKR